MCYKEEGGGREGNNRLRPWERSIQACSGFCSGPSTSTRGRVHKVQKGTGTWMVARKSGKRTKGE